MTKIMAAFLFAAVLFSSGCSTPSKPSSPPSPAPAPPINPPTAPIATAPSVIVNPPSTQPPNPNVTEFEGEWQGVELTDGQEGFALLKISGHNMEFYGDDDDDWVTGTFTLRTDTQPNQWVGVVTGCTDPLNVGKTSYSIYKFEDGVLTLTGGDPGEAHAPATFDAAGCRVFVFEREQ